MSKWIDKGSYYLSSSPQGSQEWLNERKGRITGSVISRVVGHSDFDKLPDCEYALQLLGLKEKVFSDLALYRMRRGTENESVARKKLEEELLKTEDYKNTKITERGLAVWKKDERFAVSLDGIIEFENGEETDTGIEIKCPSTLYSNIRKAIENDKLETLDIYPSHYDQMMINGVLTGKKYMIYCVYAIDDEKMVWFKIPVDYDYWEFELYPKACNFYDTYMKNIIDEFEINIDKIKCD